MNDSLRGTHHAVPVRRGSTRSARHAAFGALTPASVPAPRVEHAPKPEGTRGDFMRQPIPQRLAKTAATRTGPNPGLTFRLGTASLDPSADGWLRTREMFLGGELVEVVELVGDEIVEEYDQATITKPTARDRSRLMAATFADPGRLADFLRAIADHVECGMNAEVSARPARQRHREPVIDPEYLDLRALARYSGRSKRWLEEQLKSSDHPLASYRPSTGKIMVRRSEFDRWLSGKRLLIIHACRIALTVMLLPALASWLAPVSPVTIGLTSVMVMAVPTKVILEADMRVIVQRSAHRVIGCLLGALLGLACLAVVGSDFVLWVLLLATGVWLCSQIQTGTTGISYVGTQAMLAFVMSMVQSLGPPLSISPGLERLVGVMAGLCLMFVITLILSLIPISEPVRSSAVDD